jgi:hypothetical protein
MDLLLDDFLSFPPLLASLPRGARNMKKRQLSFILLSPAGARNMKKRQLSFILLSPARGRGT